MLEFRIKIIDFKLTILIILTGLSHLCYSQKTLKDFEGDLVFKESNNYFALTRFTYDTVNVYYSYSINQHIVNIERFSSEKSFLPIILYKNGDSLFFKYQERFSDVPDTIISKLFSLSFNDTIEKSFCYRIIQDTIRWTDIKRTLEIKLDCDGDAHDMKTYRLKDTSLIFKDYNLECYYFKQVSKIGHYKDVFFTRNILVEKNTLIPIDVKEYNFHTSKRPRYRNKIQGQNLLTMHKKLISIE